MGKIESVIFDCDGVLVDSEIIACRIEVELLAHAGYEIAVEHLVERFSGLNWATILSVIDRESGLNLTDSLLDKTEALLDVRIPADVQVIDGVAEVLEALNLPSCVCSNTKRDRLLQVLDVTDLRRHFGGNIFSAKDLGEGHDKPKPDIFLHGLRRMAFDPATTVVVEDSVHGVHGARAAGVRVIGFTGGSHSYRGHARKLIEAGAGTAISRMRDLPELIASMN